jgi:Dolichyl-phosphate-mannose-protein mannosyltransferase
MSTAAIERRALRELPVVAPVLGVGAAIVFLLARAAPDIHGKPWQEDEAVAGLISARPLGELLQTVVLDRAGAPLHFVLMHVAFAIDGSPWTLRWLSLAVALATIPLCYDLARRLAGELAGVAAALLTASSQLLTTYATFGRMYALFACTSALSLDLFVRAVQKPSRPTLAAATAAAMLPVLAHPFGVFVLGGELAVAAWLWRWRAMPAGVVGLALALPYVRLSGRYEPDAGMSAPEAAWGALGGPPVAVLAVLALVGASTLPRRFAALGLLVLVSPPVVLAVTSSDELSPRHLIFMLPMWTALVGAGVVHLPARVVVAAAAVALAALAPAAVADPRVSRADVTDAAAWVRADVRAGDALYPYSPVFLAALPQTSRIPALPREPVALERALRRTKTTRRTLIAIPSAHRWLILRVNGPFSQVPRALARIAPRLRGTARAAVLQLYATSTEGTSPHRSSSR